MQSPSLATILTLSIFKIRQASHNTRMMKLNKTHERIFGPIKISYQIQNGRASEAIRAELLALGQIGIRMICVRIIFFCARGKHLPLASYPDLCRK
jgi:hypothetical protein